MYIIYLTYNKDIFCFFTDTPEPYPWPNDSPESDTENPPKVHPYSSRKHWPQVKAVSSALRNDLRRQSMPIAISSKPLSIPRSTFGQSKPSQTASISSGIVQRSLPLEGKESRSFEGLPSIKESKYSSSGQGNFGPSVNRSWAPETDVNNLHMGKEDDKNFDKASEVVPTTRRQSYFV